MTRARGGSAPYLSALRPGRGSASEDRRSPVPATAGAAQRARPPRGRAPRRRVAGACARRDLVGRARRSPWRLSSRVTTEGIHRVSPGSPVRPRTSCVPLPVRGRGHVDRGRPERRTHSPSPDPASRPSACASSISNQRIHASKVRHGSRFLLYMVAPRPGAPAHNSAMRHRRSATRDGARLSDCIG